YGVEGSSPRPQQRGPSVVRGSLGGSGRSVFRDLEVLGTALAEAFQRHGREESHPDSNDLSRRPARGPVDRGSGVYRRGSWTASVVLLSTRVHGTGGTRRDIRPETRWALRRGGG